jgi:hypothetical protein
VPVFSTPTRPAWRWHIVNYAGDIIEESHDLTTTEVRLGKRRHVEVKRWTMVDM